MAKTNFERLESLPIREHNDFYPLEDILASQENVGKDVNLLFAIRQINEPVEAQNRQGKTYVKMELIVFDQTYDFFKLVLWDTEMIAFAQTWSPMRHIVFAVDLTISYSPYEKSIYAIATSKTIFTVNPCTKEGYLLYNYVPTAQLTPIIPLLDKFKSQAVKCTIEELRNLFCNDMLDTEFVLLNAVVSEFNIDENFAKCFMFRCNNCYGRLDNNIRRCYKRECSQLPDSINNYSKLFDYQMSVSDHTSTLANVRVTSKLFENIFNFSLDKDYERVQSLTSEELTELKWKVLLERWRMLIKITTVTLEEDNQDSIKYYFKCISLEKIDKE